jgi:putative ABC transport system permease protein
LKRVRWTLSWALASLRHRKARAVFAAGGVALATALATSVLGFQRGYERSLEHSIAGMGYQVLLTGKGCPHEAATLILRGGTIPMYIDEALFATVLADEAVADAARFFMQSGPPPGRDRSGDEVQLYVGVDDAFLRLKPGVEVQRGSWLASPSADEVVLGYNVADYRRLGVGDTVRVRGRDLAVAGVLEKLGTQDDGTVFLPLARAQSIFDRRDQLTGIGVRLHDLEDAPAFLGRAWEWPGVQVVRLSQVQSRLLSAMGDVRALLLALGAVVVGVALLGVVNASLLGALERRREMGVLRSLGCSAADLFQLVWSETLLLAALGAAAGAALAFVLAGAVEWSLRRSLAFAPPGDLVAVSASQALATAAVVVLLCLAGTVLPAWRAAGSPPLVSMRRPA